MTASKPAKQPHTRAWSLRWPLAMLMLLPLLTMSLTSCCPAQVSPPIALGESEIQRNPDGSWRVSSGWLARNDSRIRALLQRCPDR